MRSFRLIAGCALVLTGLAACDDSRDTEVVTEPVRWSIAPDPLLTIGAVDGPPEFVFSRIRAVRLFPDGRVIVADGSSGSLRIYSAGGSYLHEMGGSGDGPGEFRYLSAVHLAGGDTLLVYDSRALRLTTFLSSGELVGSQQLRPGDGVPELYVGTYGDGSHSFGWIKQSPIAPDRLTADSMRIGRFTSDGNAAGVIARATGMHRLGSPVPLSPHLLVGMIGDSVVITNGMEGRVRIVGPTGEAVRTLQLAGADWTFEEAMRLVEERLEPSEIDRFQRVKGTDGVNSVPEFSELLIDSENLIWLKLYDPATDSHWLSRRLTGGEWIVADTGGRQIARVAMPVGFRPMDVRADRIAGVVRDELGVERVRVYALYRIKS
ncbi:MAG TPA: hypothetical protein VFI91_01450 [Longimicrobiaceae bacterium]|nr:hypothetical protein [Longimicrobiaceae bacterium]